MRCGGNLSEICQEKESKTKYDDYMKEDRNESRLENNSPIPLDVPGGGVTISVEGLIRLAELKNRLKVGLRRSVPDTNTTQLPLPSKDGQSALEVA